MNDEKICIVTGIPVSDTQPYGKFHSRIINKLYKKYSCDIEETRKHLNELIYIEEYKTFYSNWHDCSKGMSKRKKHNIDKKYLFEKYFKKDMACILDDCDNRVEYDHISTHSCCLLHYNQSRSKHKTNRENFKYICLEDDNRFPSLNRLTIHIKSLGISPEEYYRKHLKEENCDECKWCGKKTKFKNVEFGYTKFCHNSSCNVLWYNKHQNRAKNASTKIRKTFLEGDRLPSQVPYWIKKGYDEETAKQMVSDRQTTNSVEAIMKRGNYTKIEAEQIRSNITEKWIKSFKKMTYSKISQELFWSIYTEIENDYSDIFFATLDPDKKRDESSKNHEFLVNVGKTHRKLDFYIKDNNKCIEFDGTYWHGIKGKGNKSREEEREKQIIHSIKCKILHIKEFDYINNKKETVNKCLDFIKNG